MVDLNTIPPPGWAFTRLDAFGQLYCGQSPSVAEVNNEGKGLLYVTGPEQWNGQKIEESKWTEHPKRIVPNGCIFITVKGAGVGKLFPGVPCAIGRDIYAYQPDSSINSKFIFYSLKHNIDKVILQAKGDIPGLSKNHILDHTIGLPPIPEQARIVEKIEELFSELDKGVESLKTVKKQLKVYRQALLKHAFEGKLTAQWREENKDKLESADQLLDRIKAEREAYYQRQLKEWEQSLKDWESEGKLGKKPVQPKNLHSDICISENTSDLPEGWCYLKFKDLILYSQNGISKRRGDSGSLVNVLRLADVVSSQINYQNLRSIALTLEEVKSYKLGFDDLLCIRVNGSPNLVGRMIHVKHESLLAFCDHFIRFKFIASIISTSYLEQFFNTYSARRYIELNKVSSAGQNTISQSTLGELLVPYCSIEEQLVLSSEISHKLTLIERVEQEIESQLIRIEALRQSILKKAFSGQLVPQDPNDEPASVLLERVKAEKASQSKPPKNKKPKSKSIKEKEPEYEYV